MSESYDTQPYIDAINVYREALRDALAVCDNTFQPPEVHAGTASKVVSASWIMQIEFAALMNYRKNVK